mgnify:CR=1 FL=1
MKILSATGHAVLCRCRAFTCGQFGCHRVATTRLSADLRVCKSCKVAHGREALEADFLAEQARV